MTNSVHTKDELALKRIDVSFLDKLEKITSNQVLVREQIDNPGTFIYSGTHYRIRTKSEDIFYTKNGYCNNICDFYVSGFNGNCGIGILFFVMIEMPYRSIGLFKSLLSFIKSVAKKSHGWSILYATNYEDNKTEYLAKKHGFKVIDTFFNTNSNNVCITYKYNLSEEAKWTE